MARCTVRLPASCLLVVQTNTHGGQQELGGTMKQRLGAKYSALGQDSHVPACRDPGLPLARLLRLSNDC